MDFRDRGPGQYVNFRRVFFRCGRNGSEDDRQMTDLAIIKNYKWAPLRAA